MQSGLGIECRLNEVEELEPMMTGAEASKGD